MATISNFTKRVTAINFDQIKVDAVEETKDAIIQLNKDQLTQGLLSTGQAIQPLYKNKYYAIKKNVLNPIAGLGKPDLKLTGDFYKGIFVKVDKTTFTIDSNDAKSGKLETEYSNLIFGLDQPSKEAYAKTLSPVLIGKLRAAAGM